MATSKTDRLAMLQKQLEQSEKQLAALRSAVKAENTKIRNGQLMAWGEALEAAYLAASDEGQKSHIEAMILGALKGEGAKVKMWRKRAAEGFARLKGVEQPAEPQKPVVTPEKKPEAVAPTQSTPNQKAIKSPQIVELTTQYKEKDEAAALGARYNNEKKVWWVPANTDLRPFEKWLPQPLSKYDIF